MPESEALKVFLHRFPREISYNEFFVRNRYVYS